MILLILLPNVLSIDFFSSIKKTAKLIEENMKETIKNGGESFKEFGETMKEAAKHASEAFKEAGSESYKTNKQQRKPDNNNYNSNNNNNNYNNNYKRTFTEGGQTSASKKHLTNLHFQEIDVKSSLTVILSQGSQGSLDIQGDDSLIPYIQTTIQNNVLYISFSGTAMLQNIALFASLRIYVTFVDLTKIHCSGSSDIQGNSLLKFNILDIHVTGSSDLKLNLIGTSVNIHASGSSDINLISDTNTLTTQVSGSSDVKLSGKTNTLKAIVSGASDFQAFNLKAQFADIKLSGSSDAQITAVKELKYDVTGASDLEYRGNPRITKANKQVSSTINGDSDL